LRTEERSDFESSFRQRGNPLPTSNRTSWPFSPYGVLREPALAIVALLGCEAGTTAPQIEANDQESPRWQPPTPGTSSSPFSSTKLSPCTLSIGSSYIGGAAERHPGSSAIAAPLDTLLLSDATATPDLTVDGDPVDCCPACRGGRQCAVIYRARASSFTIDLGEPGTSVPR